MTAFLITWGVTRLATAQAAPPSAPAGAAVTPSAAQPAPAAVAPAPQSAAGPGAQGGAPTQPPPYPYQYPPPPAYPYQYPPPPGYAYPGYGFQQRRPPDSVPYQGGPVPAGYHLEERPRRGLIISGALLTGIPWAIGLAGVSSANFPNQSGWLVVPVLGPWLTLATRHESHCTDNDGYDVCLSDDENGLARTALVFDGLMQATGAVLFIVGISSKNQVLARDLGANLHFTPAAIGHYGYGGVLSGDF